MKPGAFLVNTSQGKLVDTTALIEALTEIARVTTENLSHGFAGKPLLDGTEIAAGG